MRHLKAYRKLNRTGSHRSLMLRNLVTSLFEHERVETTVMKAKEARRIAERMITLGKRGTLHARRRAASVLLKKSVVKKLFDEIAPRYAKREGGYTRILRVGYRKGDAAPLAFLELIMEETERKKGKKKGEPREAKMKPSMEKAEKEKAATIDIKEENTSEGAEADGRKGDASKGSVLESKPEGKGENKSGKEA